MKVLVTGAGGYIGRAVLRDLGASGYDVVAAVRDPARLPPKWRARAIGVGDLGPDTDWSAALRGVAGVIHLAGPAATEGIPETDLVRAIVEGSKRLAEAAAVAGVRRFVFVSSVKAAADLTPVSGLDETASPAPADAYGRCKLAAELAIVAAASGDAASGGVGSGGARSGGAGMTVAILRPAPVYGPGSGGNLRRMIDFLRSAPPVLPLGIAGNRRSFLHRDNLCAAILAGLEHPDAAGRTFFVTDGEALSTGDLTRRILQAHGRRALLLPVSAAALRVLGRPGHRLGGSSLYDEAALRTVLGWKPVVDPRAGMLEAVRQTVDPLLSAAEGQP